MARVRFVRRFVGVGGIAAVLVAAVPDLPTLAAGLADPQRWVDHDGLDVVLAQLVGAAAWLTALWLAAGLVLVAGSRLPGAAGRTSAVLARGAMPAGLRRTAAVLLGAGLATSAASLPSAAAEGRGTPSAAASTSPAAPWPADIDHLPARADLTGSAPPRTSADALDQPLATTLESGADASAALPADAVDWPADPTSRTAPRPLPVTAVDWPPAPTSRTRQFPATAVDWPAAPTSRTRQFPATVVDWPAAPTTRAATPATAVDRPVVGDAAAGSVDWPLSRGGETRSTVASRSVAFAPGAEPVIVAPGDTLWAIASRRLGPTATAPAIAIEWRRWHAANRALIGSDPRRLRPGTALTPPTTADR